MLVWKAPVSIKVLMSKLGYCFEPYKSPNVHATNKRICDEHVRQHSTSKNLFFIIYLLEDEQELSLGMLIRLQPIYNFWLFHVVILSFLDVLQSFYYCFISFLVLTYWHNAKCQLLFSACFLHCRKSISDGVQMPRNSTMIFYGPEGTQRALVAPWGSPEEGTTHQGMPRGPGAP